MAARRGRPTPHRSSFHLARAAVIFLLAAAHTLLARAQEPPAPWVLCSPPPSSGNYSENSTYQGNIKRLSTTVPKAASSAAEFYTTDSVGSVPNMVYAQALCRGDANASDCETCVATAFQGAQQACPLVSDVLIFYEVCQLRFSNRNFLLDDDYFVTTYYLQSSQNVSVVPVEEFDAAVRLLVNATAEHAAAGLSRKFGTGVEGFGDGESNRPKIYALSQCAPDRTVDVCRTCLGTVIRQLPNYFSGKNGGGVFGVWCSFRYEVYPFFSGDPLLQLPAFVTTPVSPSPSPVTTRKDISRKGTGTILAIVMPAIGALVVIITMVLCFWRSRSATQSVPPYSTSWPNDIESADMLLLDLATLRVATEDFAENKMLGKGGFGTVYQGTLPEGQEIAVKRLCQTSRQGMEELKSELVLVAELHHRNLVRLIGVCLQEQEKILVYEYMPNKSLDTILFNYDRNKELDWGKRFRIINGIAKGLQYLHEDSQLKIVHRDLKASNVLLDFDYVPKISDFGLAKIFGDDKSQYVTLRIAGTYGYMAPEYAMRGQYSIKSDVFSFGVLVLEIITGRSSASYSSDQDVDLLSLVWEKWTRGSVIELIDPSLRDHPPPIEQLLKCIHIGLLCVQRKPTARPVMSWVNIMLSSNTVRLPSFSRPAFCVQEISERASSDEHSATWLEAPGYTTNNSEMMSCNEASFTELSPR